MTKTDLLETIEDIKDALTDGDPEVGFSLLDSLTEALIKEGEVINDIQK